VFHFLNGTWTLITATFQASVAVQYDNHVYLVPDIGHNGLGGKWEPVGGFTVIAAIPTGQAAVIHKERLFLAPGVDSTTNSSRLNFSNPGNLDVWSASDFIDIMPGDGTKVTDLTVYRDNLLIFKTRSTWILAYDVEPADAVVRHTSLTIGVERHRRMLNYENQVYIFHGGWVYEIINYDFHRLNTKVPFVIDETAPSPVSDEIIHLSQLEDRLICRIFNKIYLYGLRTRTWSEWSSARNELHFFGPIVTLHFSEGEHKHYAGSAVLSQTSFIELFDEATLQTEETLDLAVNLIACRTKTKNFDLAVSHQFKRLWWWGADVTSRNDITGIATPIIASFDVAWQDIEETAWQDLGTWAQPLDEPGIVQTVQTTQSGVGRRFAKFLRGLRFRQINFAVELTTNGSTVDGPGRVFTMTIITESKQTVPKGVN